MPEVTPTPSNTGKKSHVWLWALLVILVLIALGLVTCTWAFKLMFTPSNIEVSLNSNASVPSLNLNTVNLEDSIEPRVESEITDSDLAVALIASENLVGVEGLDTVRPSIIELADHLDNTPPDTYDFFVARSWSTVPDGELKIGTALVKNNSTEDAASFIQIRSEGKTILTGAPDLGDATIMYYEPPAEGVPASVTIRFTQGTLAAKVQVMATDPFITDAETQANLIPLATALATVQSERIDAFMANALYEWWDTTPPMEKAPTSLIGGTYVGTVFVSEEEWLGVTGDFSQDANISGLVDGALSRFIVDARPEEVAEVTVMQFFTNSLAEAFQAELLVDPSLTESAPVELTGDLDTAADAVASASIAEMQIVVENYVIDLSIFSPFGSFDQAAATADLITMGQDILTNFSAE